MYEYIYIYINYIYIYTNYIYIYIYIPWLPSSMSNNDGKWVFYDFMICIYIYIYIYIYSQNRKLSFTHNGFRWCCYRWSVYKGCHFLLLIWPCLGIKPEVDVVLGTTTFLNSVFLLSKVWKIGNAWNFLSPQVRKCYSSANCWYCSCLLCCL